MRRRTFTAAVAVAATTSMLSLPSVPFAAVAQDAPGPVDQDAPLVARDAEAVVLTGVDLPTWSRLPATGQPATYPAGTDDQNFIGDQVRSAHHGTIVVPPDPLREGNNADVDAVAAYRWSGSGWVEVPVQVDERFPYFLANARSTFSVYSGVDTELTYAWNPSAHAHGEESWKMVAGECFARYAADLDEAAYLASDATAREGKAPLITPGLGETLQDYLAAMADPVPGLDDDDEVVFLASDAGPKAPLDAAAPAPADAGSRHEVSLVDPITGEQTFVYLFLQDGGSSYTPETGYVSHVRDDSAAWWASRDAWDPTDPEKLGTSNTNYGSNLSGTACLEADGTDYTQVEPYDAKDRFPLDGMTVRTDRYEYTATGRWMSRGLRVADPDAGLTTPGTPLVDRLDDDRYGPDLIDRWKGRAFQQSPDSFVSLVGFEDEQVNWEANSTLLGWRSGPVRAIREIWGADSGTNVTKTEFFYRDGVKHTYHVRVHPIPSDGLYTSWDYNRDVAGCFYNSVTTVTHAQDEGDCTGGVPVDGINDENVGNVDGVDFYDDPFYFDATDPTFSTPLAVKRWEQFSGKGDAGSLVYQFDIDEASSYSNPLIVPYYRDDACLDDGTGDDPVARPWPGEDSRDERVTSGYSDLNGDGEIRCEDGETQGAHGAHGVHFFFTHDSDNAFVGTPIGTTEIVGSQWQFAVPTERPSPVGERYAEMLRAPLVTVVTEQGPATEALEAGGGTGRLRAGAAIVDSTWHVGSAAGQYAGKNVGMVDYHNDNGVDPHGLSTSSEASYGVQGREHVRALLVEGADGTRFGVVSNDLYLPQAVAAERVAQLLAEHDAMVAAGLKDGPIVGLSIDELTMSVSHSHSSPYYSSTAPGPWIFEDVFDLRFFEHITARMAEAMIDAAAELQPVRVGGAEATADVVVTHTYGPAIGEAGTTPGSPAGAHYRDGDTTMTVVAFDALDSGEPVATWVTWGLHPELLDGNDLLAAEWWNTSAKIVERELGGVTLFSQRDTGTSENRGADLFDPQSRSEFNHREYAQAERASRLIADAVAATRDAIDGADAPVATDRTGRPVAVVNEQTIVPFTTDAPVGVTSVRFAPPGAQASPEVSNCNTENALAYDPGIPVAGLPDCFFFGDNPVSDQLNALPFNPRATVNEIRALGIPVPSDYGAPSAAALEESVAIRLQAMRIGDIAVTVCPCEQFGDQSRNIVTRLNDVADDLFFGFDWTANELFTDGYTRGVRYDGEHGPLQLPFVADEWFPGIAERGLDAPEFFCTPLDAQGNALPTGADGEPADAVAADAWRCLNPNWQRSPWQEPRSNDQLYLAPISDLILRTMKAQIYNDAAGWDAPGHALDAESESPDPAEIRGNYTHEELHDVMAGGGYRLVVPVGMANDYFGYTPSYREYRAHDHYRKALSGLGAHGEDFFATRLTRLAATLKGAPDNVPVTPKDRAYAAFESARIADTAHAIGALADAYLPAYELRLPADGAEPSRLAEPSDITWFDAAEFTFVGGSNYTDVPDARVERLDEETGEWLPFAGDGEVQVMADFPQPEELPVYFAGAYAWEWTATFEAFTSDIALPDASGIARTATPAGTYRFVVEGCHRGVAPDLENGPADQCRGHDLVGRARPYTLVSDSFEVRPWDGITIDRLAVDGDGVLTLDAGPVADGLHRFNTEQLHLDSDGHVAAFGAIALPTSYDSPFDVIADGVDLRAYRTGDADDEVFCFHCSFRPWAQTDQVVEVEVTLTKGNRTQTITAPYDPETGQLGLAVKRNTTVTIDAQAISTALGTTNADTATLTRPAKGDASTSGGAGDPVGAATAEELDGDDDLIEWLLLSDGTVADDAWLRLLFGQTSVV